MLLFVFILLVVISEFGESPSGECLAVDAVASAVGVALTETYQFEFGHR